MSRPKNRDSVPCIIGASHPRTRHMTDDVHYKQCDRHWSQLQRVRRENIKRLRAYALEVAKDLKLAVGMLSRHFSGR